MRQPPAAGTSCCPSWYPHDASWGRIRGRPASAVPLHRRYDGARAANLAEYRNAVLSRLVFPELLADLLAQATANTEGDAEEVYRKAEPAGLHLSDMAERAARFYLLPDDLSRTTETSAEVFLAHKDALPAHLRQFTSELARNTPKLAAALGAVEETGVDRTAELAASVDERIFRSPGRPATARARRMGDRQHEGTVRHLAGNTRPALNLPTSDTHVAADWLRDAADFGIPVRLTLHQLGTDPLTVVAPGLYVCDNPAVLRAAGSTGAVTSTGPVCAPPRWRSTATTPSRGT